MTPLSEDVAVEKPPEIRAERLSLAELDAAIAASPIAYLPLGTLEFHGPHLPIGLDALNAQALCEAAARITGGIVLPVVYQGTGGGHGAYPWTIMMPGPDAIVANLKTTLTRLEDFGVRRAVVFTGHFADEQLAMVDELTSTWNASDSALTVVGSGVNRCADAPLPPDHAGAFEATLLYASAPELVHLERLPDVLTHPTVDPDDNPFGTHRHDPGHPLWGVFGADPRPADLSKAPELLAHLAGWLADLARR
ncbi:creatininase family protein [Subtercola endophyticus]|uniref:creatininase family protein n=1 Tax=Subtercola endophyticus TaxID=2895559 RepID=UPI001E2A5CB7|nr:creatininase family protein [Subtercola endophyticus]UFS59159.1 creatininase family protein [Subtercola endophyticus]